MQLSRDLGPQKMMYFGSFILITSSLFVFTIGRFFGWIIWFKGPIDPNLCEQFCAIDSLSGFAAFKLRGAR